MNKIKELDNRVLNIIKISFISMFMILLFFNNIPYLNNFSSAVLPALLPIGGIIFLYDVLFKRISLNKMPYSIYILFIISYLITIIFNIQNNAFSNFKTICWFMVLIFVVGNICRETQWETVKKGLICIMGIFIILTFIASIVSIYYFIIMKEFAITINGSVLHQGYHYNRLYGVYREPNFSAWFALASIIFSVLLIKIYKKRKKLLRFFLISNIIIQYIYFILSNSRGALVAAMAMFLLTGLCYLLRPKAHQTRKRVILGIMVIIMLTGAIIPIRIVSQKLLAYLPVTAKYIETKIEENNKEENNTEENNTEEKNTEEKASDLQTNKITVPDIGRLKYEGTDYTTNRLPAWEASIKVLYSKNLAFGLGDRNIGLYVTELITDKKTIAHNGTTSSSVVRLLVSSGIIGFIILFSALFYYLYICINMLKKNVLKNQDRIYLEASFICCGTCFVSSLFLEDLFLCTAVSSILFWGCVGFAFYLKSSLKNKNSSLYYVQTTNDKGSVAFFAATPYQVINTINIREKCMANKNADLYIMDYATDTKGCFNAVKKSDVFQNVYYIKDPWNKKGRLRFLWSYIFPAQRIMKIISCKVYDAMFGTRIGMANNFYYTHLSNNNEDMTFHYYEEGIGDYILEITPRNTFLVKFSRIIGYKNAFNCVNRFWLYKPECRRQNMQYEVCTIPAIDMEMSLLVLSIFNKRDNQNIPQNCKVLYFDQAYKEQLDIDFDNIHVLKLINKLIDKKDIFIKLHPGSNPDKYANSGYNVLPNTSIPWEVQLTNINFKNILMVSVNSTAVITPITMYNRNVNVILLYNCFPDSRFINIDKQDEYFNCIKQENGKGKLYIPQDSTELIDDIKKFLNEG